MIKTSLHTLKFSNNKKLIDLSIFIDEYRRCASIIINDIWENGYSWISKDDKLCKFDVKNKQLFFPQFIDYNKFELNTFLTARVLRCLTTQIAGIISAEVEKQRKRLFILEQKKNEKISKNKLKPLIKKIKQNIPVKPNCNNINPELNSICCDWQSSDKEFSGFLKLKSITKTKMEICLPIKFHNHSNKLKNIENSQQMTSYLICKNKINIR